MAGIGHNRGPSMEPGFGFRKLAWGKARRALLPTLPLEIVRVRVARAERLGLPYRTYAAICATTGRDIVAFLFSSNSLGLAPQIPGLPEPVGACLARLGGAATRLAAVHAPLAPEAVLSRHPGLLEDATAAPVFGAPHRLVRDRLRGFAREVGVAPDGLVVISATAEERSWADMAALAGAVDRTVFFDRA